MRFGAFVFFAFFISLPMAFGDSNRITLDGVSDKDFSAMKGKVKAFEKNFKLSRKEMDKRNYALSNGKMWSITRKGRDGMMEEWTEGLIKVPFEKFVEKIPPEKWGPNLADYVGGEVKPYGEGRQIERMILKAPLKNMDMTKIEEIIKKTDSKGRLVSAKIIWEVLKSDNGTVVTDIGHVTFSRWGRNYTKVLFRSSHKLNMFPFNSPLVPQFAKDWILGKMLSSSFKKHIKKYKKTTLKAKGFLKNLKDLFH